MKIYRFEYQSQGIYQARGVNQYIDQIMENFDLIRSPNTPSPMNDKGMTPHYNKIGNNNFLFGFASFEQLLNWFPIGAVEELLDIGGATLRIIEIPSYSVFQGEKQCLFSKYAFEDNIDIKSFEGFKKYFAI